MASLKVDEKWAKSWKIYQKQTQEKTGSPNNKKKKKKGV